MKKRVLALMLAGVMIIGMGGCGNSSSESTEEASAKETTGSDEAEIFDDTTVTIFAAKSLNQVVDELIALYNETQPNVEIITSYDSSGTLMEQIKEGAECDIFFSAAQSQMNTLEEEGLLIDGTRANVVNNQVCVVTYTDSNTTVTGLENIAEASSFALADGSVPVGKYTRQALVNAGMLEETDDVAGITTQEVSDALGGIEINECANVGAVAAAVAEGSNEVGTVYKSDTVGYEDDLVILEIISYDLTGNVIYPIAQVVNSEADQLESDAALDFIRFLTSDTAKAVYENYYFDTDVE